MKTYIFNYKNGNAVITISSDSEQNAWGEIDELAKDKEMFRLESVMDEDGSDVEID